MTSVAALLDGIRRLRRAPAIIFSVWLLTIAVSAPLALGLRSLIREHLGESMAAAEALNGVNYEWWQEFSDQATGLGVTFRPTIIGFGAVLDNLSGFLDNDARPVVVAGAAVAYIVMWIFLAGGIIDRFARDRATRSYGFFAVAGTFFFRFLRLAVVMWIVYGFLFGLVHPWLFGDAVYGRLTRDLTVERTAFFINAGLYIIFGALLAACNIVFDYAKVRAVVEDRRSMLGAIAAAIGFIQRNLAAAAGLYLLDFGLFLVAVAIYALIAPGAGGGGASIWIGFAIGQLYILARLKVKLVFWASEVALFQSRLAHAGYVAAPKPVWPDSPTAEAIARS
jgi:hypothetical protein